MNNWQHEIIELHDFFQGWLNGTLEPTDTVFARLVDATDEDFLLISPDGTSQTRSTLIAHLRAAHATRPNWRMWIERPQLRVATTDLIVATYEEWHQTGEQITARLSTVIFRPQASAPLGVVWVHVHETWKTVSA